MINRQQITSVLAVLMAVALIGQGAIAASNGNLNFSSTDANVPNPHITTDVTKASHDMQNMSSVLEYEDDSGSITTLPASVNNSNDNPVSLVATNIEFDDAGAFPHSKDGVSALDASEWSDSGLTTSDTTTAPGVEAIEVATNGSMASGDTVSATFNNFSIDSDAKKRYLSVAVDVTTLDSGTTAYVVATDDDGDEKRLVIDSAKNAANQSVIANSTGEGKVAQVQLGKLDTAGNGDGSFDSIDSITVEAADGDITASVSVLNADKKSPYVFGEQSTDDGTETITEPRGEYSVTGVDTLGGTFDTAVIHGLTVDVKFRAADLAEADIEINSSAATAYPNFDKVVDIYYRINLPDAYDLSYSGAELRDTVEWPGERYLAVGLAEGAGDTAFEDVSYSDQAGSYNSQGDAVTLDSTIQPGQEYAIHYELKLTQGEFDGMVSSAAMGPMGNSDGGLGSWPVIGLVVSALGALYARARGLI